MLVTLCKEDKDVTPSGVDFRIKLIDNQFDTHPEIHISYQDALRLAEGLKEMMHIHHNLFKEEKKKL